MTIKDPARIYADRLLRSAAKQYKKEIVALKRFLAPDWEIYQREFGGAEAIAVSFINSRGELRLTDNPSEDERVCVFDSGDERDIDQRVMTGKTRNPSYGDYFIFKLNRPLEQQ